MSSTIVVSEQVDSALEFTGDVDKYDIFLAGGKSYEFHVKGLPDSAGIVCHPELAIYAGPYTTRLAFNDNDKDDPEVHVCYTATSGGWYAVEVAGHNGSSGYYRLTSAMV
jgi:hypothetical protein